MVKESILGKRYRFNEDMMPEGLTQPQRKARQFFLENVHGKNNYLCVTECPYCGYGAFRKISEMDRRGLPSEIVICERCEGCFKMRILNAEANAFHYSKISYILRGKTYDRDAMEKLFQKRIEMFALPRFHFINKFVELTPGKDLVAEFGCNDGANLIPWKEKGFDTIGLDLDHVSIEVGRSKGLNLVCGDFLDYSDRKPSLIMLSHLLEHVADINGALKKICQVISPNGYLFIESPGIRVQALGDSLAYFDVEHNYNFSLASLKKLFDAYSLNIIYEDEYTRVICTPSSIKRKVHDYDNRIPLLTTMIKRLVNIMPYGNMKLENLLRENENGGLGIKVFNRLQRVYYKSYYASFRL